MEKISVAVRFRPPKSPAYADADSSAFSGGGTGGNREWRIDDTRISLLHRAVPVPGTSFAFGTGPPALSLPNPTLSLNF
jgi:centromeric protein E